MSKASIQNVDALVSSATSSSSHSSGSGKSLLNVGRPGSVASGVGIMANPSSYHLPGATPDSYILYSVASARIYHSSQLLGNHSGSLSFGKSQSLRGKKGGSQWVYSHLKGTLVFGRDKYSSSSGAATVDEIVASGQRGKEPCGEWWFQLADDEAGKVLWKFKIPVGAGTKFSYELDRPFFHVFQGSSRKYGFLFDDDKESAMFSEEVQSRITTALAATSKPSNARSSALSIKSNKKIKSHERSNSCPTSGGVLGTGISHPTPNSFRHVAHIGFNQNSGAIETSKDLDPAFRSILADLQVRTGSNVKEAVVLEHLDFIQGTWRDVNSIRRSNSGRSIVAN